MTEITPSTRRQLAARVAVDLQDGWYVNLGLGLPIMVGAEVPSDREVVFHSENGLLGLGGPAAPGAEDLDLCDAGKNYTTLRTGASTFDSSTSFAMIRGGHLDLALLGALQVSPAGDLANWLVPGRLPGVGGAMDLVQGTPRVWVVMTLFDKSGNAKLVERCELPLTGAGVVDRVYTDHGTFEIDESGLALVEPAPGVPADYLRDRLGVDFSTRPPAPG